MAGETGAESRFREMLRRILEVMDGYRDLEETVYGTVYRRLYNSVKQSLKSLEPGE